jgi:hypothetical protein
VRVVGAAAAEMVKPPPAWHTYSPVGVGPADAVGVPPDQVKRCGLLS